VNYIEYEHRISQRMIRKIISLTSDHEAERANFDRRWRGLPMPAMKVTMIDDSKYRSNWKYYS